MNKKLIISITTGIWIFALCFVTTLLLANLYIRYQKGQLNSDYLQKIERSDKYSDYFFKRAAKVYVDDTRAIASSWFYKNRYWMTARHVCDYFDRVEMPKPQIELGSGKRELIVRWKVSQVADLCVFETSESDDSLQRPELGLPDTQNLFLPNEIIVTSGFPDADEYELRAGRVIGERVIHIAGFDYIEQRVDIWVEPGMSGSAVYEANSKRVVGVISASDGRYGYIVPLNQLKTFLSEIEPELN